LGCCAKAAKPSRVHGTYEHEGSRVRYESNSSRDGYFAIFKRLTQHFKSVPFEFRRFIKEKHAMVCKAYLTRLWYLSAAEWSIIRTQKQGSSRFRRLIAKKGVKGYYYQKKK